MSSLKPEHQTFFTDLVNKTNNFGDITWMGYPVWQNVLDIWLTQEIISRIKPSLIIECGTNRGGSARFYAHLFDLMNHGRVVTVDIEKLHDISHPRIDFLIGSSTSTEIFIEVEKHAQQTDGPILVILDSDHSEQHVYKEIQLYSRFVTSGSYMLVQDGVIDTLPIFTAGRPGPLPAIERFLAESKDFIKCSDLNNRFLITHHPKGWLQRV